MPGQPMRVFRGLLLPFLLTHGIFPAMWLITVLGSGPVPNDWLLLKTVADHFVAGDWSGLYSTGERALRPGYFWLYPPFALYLVAPLAWLPEVWAYALLAVLEVVALVASIWLLRRLEPFHEGRGEWLLAIVLSAPALTTIINGQSSALIMLCVVVAATLWTRGQVTYACALLGLLAVKPNWGAVFGLFALVRGEWKGAMAMAGVVISLCVMTLPLGLQVWRDFLGISLANAEIFANYDTFKLVNLRGFMEGTLGTSDLITVVWSVAAGGLVAVAVFAWRRPGSPLRDLGIGLLLAVAANPYAQFYDALVLAVPATVWWAEHDRWRRGPWLTVGILLALAWCGEQWLYSWSALSMAAGLGWRPPVSIVGPVAALWLVLAASQTRESPALPDFNERADTRKVNVRSSDRNRPRPVRRVG
jgi:hypothetical protein